MSTIPHPKTATVAAQALYDALKLHALWAFDGDAPPISMRCEYPAPSGALTAGPNNCREFYEARQAALKQWEEVARSAELLAQMPGKEVL